MKRKNMTHDIRFGVQQGRHNAGILYVYQNTAGQKQVADYSGEYCLKIRNSGSKLGLFYRFALTTSGKLVPFLELSTGTVFCNATIDETLRVGRAQQCEKVDLRGINYFVQPAIGLRYRLCPYANLALSIGYEWDVSSQMHLKEEKKQQVSSTADWSGLRISTGIITYFKIK